MDTAILNNTDAR